MNEFVKVSPPYLNGGVPVVDLVGANGYRWSSVKVTAWGAGDKNSCVYFPPSSGLGVLQRSSALSNPWGFLASGVPRSSKGNSLFEEREDDGGETAELPELCTVQDAVICNGGTIVKVDAQGNFCVDARPSATSVRMQIAPNAKLMIIMSEAGHVGSENVTEGLLLANRMLTFTNEQLVVKLSETQTALQVLYAALQAAVTAAPTGAQAMGTAIAGLLTTYVKPTAPDVATDNLISGAVRLSDLSVPDVEDTYSVGGEEE